MFTYLRRSFSIAVYLLALTGCVTATHSPQSGFLGGYPDFAVDPGDKSLMWWEQRDFDWRQYDKVMIDPIVIYFHDDAEGKEIQVDSLSKLTSHCRREAIKQLSKDFEIVEMPGAGVLRVRAALTNVIPANATLNVATALLAFVPLDMGGASMEVEFIDAESQVRQAAGMDTKLGVPTQVRAGFTSLGHAQQACRQWSEELVAALKTNP